MNQGKVIDANGHLFHYVFRNGQKDTPVDYMRGGCRLLGDAVTCRCFAKRPISMQPKRSSIFSSTTKA